jgi:hypothetical protein
MMDRVRHIRASHRSQTSAGAYFFLRAELVRLPLFVGLFAADVDCLVTFPLAGAGLFEVRASDVVDFLLAAVAFFGADRDARLGVAAAAFFFCLAALRFFAITAPETAPMTVPTIGTPNAVPAMAPATAPPRVLLAVLLLSPASSPDFLVSSIANSLLCLASLLQADGGSEQIVGTRQPENAGCPQAAASSAST